MNKIQVGKRYKCKYKNWYPNPKGGADTWEVRGYFTIVYREKTMMKDDADSYGTRNYLGISDCGEVVQFDCRGEDEWMEFGGCWWALDLSESYPPEWNSLSRVENGK